MFGYFFSNTLHIILLKNEKYKFYKCWHGLHEIKARQIFCWFVRQLCFRRKVMCNDLYGRLVMRENTRKKVKKWRSRMEGTLMEVL
jgi:hypothetical protein